MIFSFQSTERIFESAGTTWRKESAEWSRNNEVERKIAENNGWTRKLLAEWTVVDILWINLS